MTDGAPETAGDVPRGRFTTTHWSVVVRAGRAEDSAAGEALGELCRVYWYPLYALARREGCSAPEAEDLTQAFFARLLARNFVARADAAKGRFRTFLLTLFRRFRANEWHRDHRRKRGGFQSAVPIDAVDAESRYGLEPVSSDRPDALFDRQWVQALLDQVLRRLEGEYRDSGRGPLFERLEACLARDETALPYAEIGRELGISEAAVKMAMQRLRSRYRLLLREEIARTVASPEEVESELRDLFRAFA